jgi:hypothetical protein
MTIEIVSVSVEVPNPSSGFWASGKGAVKVTRFSPPLKRNGYRIFIDYNSYFRFSSRRATRRRAANCHEDSPL